MEINIDNLFDANKIQIQEDVSNMDCILEYEQILLSISKVLMKYRNENNLTQKELARNLKINQVMISKLERGNYNPTIKLLYNISRSLTKSSDLFIKILMDIITSLYKSKNIGYNIQFEKHETFKFNIDKNNITYLRNNYVENIKYGGDFYGQINSKSTIPNAG